MCVYTNTTPSETKEQVATGPISGPKTGPKITRKKRKYCKLRESILPLLPKKLYSKLSFYDAEGDITKSWYIQYYFVNPDTRNYEGIKEPLKINKEHDPMKQQRLAKEGLAFVKSKVAHKATLLQLYSLYQNNLLIC